MTNPPSQIRHIAWREVFPWLILLRTFRIAISPSLLALATIAVLVTPLGWQIADRVFLTPALREAQPALRSAISIPPAISAWIPAGASNALVSAYAEFTAPLARLYRLELTLAEAAYYAFAFLWTLAIWSLPGGVITRKAIVQLATGEPLGIRSAAAYSLRKVPFYFLAPLYPLLGIVGLALPIALLGWIVWLLPGLGAALAGMIWILVAIAGLAAMWLIGGLILGWPLMWPTISAERDGDPFEAFSRSFAYVYGKPLHYFFYILVAAIFGTLCFTVVTVAASIVREFGFWALSWGSGGQLADKLRIQATNISHGNFYSSGPGSLWTVGATLVGLVLGLINSVVSAFRFSYFLCTASAIYLLLRYDVDEKEMDEVFIEPQPTTALPLATVADNSD
jgi:hypothetical protein